MERWLVVTSVGTSALTNYARLHAPEFSPILRETANSTLGDISGGQLQSLESLVEAASSTLSAARSGEWRLASAELNALHALYGRRLAEPRRMHDQHILLTSGTAQGVIVAEFLRKHLVTLGFENTSIVSFEPLTTATQRGFAQGIRQLVEWAAATLPGFRETGYHICFNLVGGFKSVQGYLNTLGMFYADEIVYIFDGENSELLRLPRLPVRLDDLAILSREPSQFALMWHGHLLPHHRARSIPEVLLDREGDVCTLSSWGQVIWERNWESVLSQSGLLDLPKVQYGASFLEDFARIRERERRARVVDSIAKLAALWLDGGLPALLSDSGLNVKLWKDGSPSRVHRFRVDLDWRASFAIERSQLLLRHVGNHEYMDKNV